MTPQGKEFGTSLLFTPRTAEKPTQPDYRSSRSVRSPSAGRASASGFGRLSSFREAGNYGPGPTRRRSLTPTGSLKDFAPPPASSLFDSPTGPPPSQVPSNTSALPGYPSATGGDLRSSQLPKQTHPEPSGTWITVFGFPPSTETLVMQEFSRCGDILYFVSAREDGVNWTHIQYANKYQAERALAKNGELLNGRLMIGVKASEPVDKTSLATSFNDSEGGMLRGPHQPAISRPYMLPNTASEQSVL